MQSNNRITVADKERLLRRTSKALGVTILPEPQVMLTATPKVPGLDGPQDVEVLREHHRPAAKIRTSVEKKMRQMQTDPARVRRTDPGTPGKSARVWDLHKLYSDETTRAWAYEGCKTAGGIGCLDCKKPVHR